MPHACVLLPSLLLLLLLCRERGARALEERLEMKKVAEAPLVESAIAAAASTLPEVASSGQQA
jgi:hypothetical protein